MGYLLHHLLSESAGRRPEAVAIRLERESLTYGELEAKSNQLARALWDAGVRRGDRVGIHLGKSLTSIVSLFGVLKAGACYVPVDKSAPARRLAAIARQCGMRSLITSAVASKRFSQDFWANSPLKSIFFADPKPGESMPVESAALSEALAGQSAERVASSGTDQDLAYILFTSGSTGEPKGVMLSHLNALTFVHWACDTFRITAEDRLSNHAPLSFDLSVFDIFAGIQAGASVSLIPEGLAVFPASLTELIEQHQITVWYSVPSVLTLLLTHGKLAERDLRTLRIILFAGEVFPVKYLRELMRAVPHPRYFNLYGPTETNVCTYYEVEPIPEDRNAPIPIGKACANTEVIPIDENGQRVMSPGHEGILYVRGSAVMQGYYGKPRETEAAFLQNPFSAGRDEKLYCTGDWVTLDERGDYHFLGRRDHLVKTRGYRVELGEVESVLYAHPAVREAVVIALPDAILGNKLRAFVVADSSASLDEQELKVHCARSLPRYMIPEEIEFRTSLPRTATEKTDRQRLKAESLKSGR